MGKHKKDLLWIQTTMNFNILCIASAKSPLYKSSQLWSGKVQVGKDQEVFFYENESDFCDL